MAKKKPTSRTDAVRQAVDQAFQAQIPRERISDLLDDLGHTASRLRGAVDELRPASAEDVKALRAEHEALAARVDAIEAAAKAKPRPAPRPVAAKPAARAGGAAKTVTSPAKPAAKRAAAKPKPAGGGS